MKKIFILILTIIFLGMGVKAYALIVGSPEPMQKGKFSIGIEGEYVIKQRMTGDNFNGFIAPQAGWLGIVWEEIQDPQIDKMYRGLIKADYAIIQGLDIYVKVGGAGFEQSSRYYVGPGNINPLGVDPLLRLNDDSDFNFAYGGGIRLSLEPIKTWFIGVDAQYLRHRDKSANQTQTFSTNVFGVVGVGVPIMLYQEGEQIDFKNDITIQQWQISLFVGKKIGKLSLYAGPRYSDLRQKDKISLFYTQLTGFIMQPFDWKVRYRSKRNIGGFAGLTFDINDNLKLNVEGSFIDQKSVGGGISYTF